MLPALPLGNPLAQNTLCNQGANGPKSKPCVWNLQSVTEDTWLFLGCKRLQHCSRVLALIPVADKQIVNPTNDLCRQRLWGDLLHLAVMQPQHAVTTPGEGGVVCGNQ